LQGMVVVVPPLRERREELAGLVRQFIHEIVADGHAPLREFSTGALDELYGMEWPGNIRQLRTTVFRSLVLARGAVVTPYDVQAAAAGGGSVQSDVPVGASGVASQQLADGRLGQLLEAVPGSASLGEVNTPAAPDWGEPELQGTAGSGGRSDSSPLPAMSQVEPSFVLPVPEPVTGDVARLEGLASGGEGASSSDAEGGSGPSSASLSPRLLELLVLARERGRLTTQDHMSHSGVSHRTALRDLQALVQFGVVERVGARRGAFYRPLPPVAN
jgi:hypothetical protein